MTGLWVGVLIFWLFVFLAAYRGAKSGLERNRHTLGFALIIATALLSRYLP